MKRPAVMLLAALLLGGVSKLPQSSFAQAPKSEHAQERAVYLAAGLSAEQVVSLSTNVTAAGKGGIVLLDAPNSRPYLKEFLKAYRPARVTLVGVIPDDVEQALAISDATRLPWREDVPTQLWQALFPRAEQVVVCAAAPRRLLLQAACLAGAARAPLFILEGRPDEKAELRRRLAAWKTRRVYTVGEKAAEACRDLTDVKIEPLADEEAVSAKYLSLRPEQAPVKTLVLTNPADAEAGATGLAVLAPYVAIERDGVLLLTNAEGTNAPALIQGAVKNPALAAVEHITLVADRRAIPMERRPNPLAGKDEHIELEPPAPAADAPFTFATGRLFHEEPGIIALLLARQRLLAENGQPRKALIVSNPGGGLPLMETISRNTAHELRNAGYETTALFHKDVTPDQVRRLLPEQDIFLWEGHLDTLVDRFAIPRWPEPMRPSLVFLQSCLALREAEAQPFLRRGAVAVIGSPSRTYSASGAAFALAYFDALAYERRSLGGALRQAKNFMLLYAQFRQKRLGDSARLAGASVRAAWAFALWGDPTLTLPAPKPPADALAIVRAEVKGDRITLRVPPTAHPQVRGDKYTAKLWPNGRLAGYLAKSSNDARTLLPFLFAEIALPDARGKSALRLRAALPDDRWMFAWDSRRGVGYLLVLPRAKDRDEIQAEILWPAGGP